MTYRLIALDLDDTLLDSKKRIPRRAKLATKKASAKGAYVILCTGRTRWGCQRFYDELGLKTLFIVSGGAEVFDYSGKALFKKYLDPLYTKKLLEYAYKNGIHAQVYINGALVVKERNRFSDVYEKSFGHPAKIMPDIMDREIVTSKVLYIADIEKIPEIREAVTKEFPMLGIKSSNPEYIEFSDPSVSKGAALKFVADHYNVGREEIIAVGDSEIDLSMFEFAGLSAAVSNANAYETEKADIICASNEEAGVADVIDKYILEV